MKTQSAKAKGRRLAISVKEKLLQIATTLSPDDILITPSSVTGEDLKLSPKARQAFPFVIECKNQEKLNIWSALDQAANHAKGLSYIPVLVFSRNRSKVYIALEFDQFLNLIGGSIK